MKTEIHDVNTIAKLFVFLLTSSITYQTKNKIRLLNLNLNSRSHMKVFNTEYSGFFIKEIAGVFTL